MKNNNSKQHNISKSKIGIVLMGLCVLAVAVVGYSQYNGSKLSNNNTSGSCDMINNKINNIQGGGCGMMGNINTTNSNNSTNNVVDQNVTYDTINVSHDAYSLVPEVVNLTVGKNYQIIIIPTADGVGCLHNLTIPGIDSNLYEIRKGEPITIIINNAKVGSYNVVCGSMGMYQGEIIIQ